MPRRTPQEVAEMQQLLDSKQLELNQAMERAKKANEEVERIRRDVNGLARVSSF